MYGVGSVCGEGWRCTVLGVYFKICFDGELVPGFSECCGVAVFHLKKAESPWARERVCHAIERLLLIFDV